ncbi:aminodeoxychorismate synthase component I [Mycobacterium tuberculosis]|nr:aminodeoxychorismate synthase component I [Mycobacterium tuberculosis]
MEPAAEVFRIRLELDLEPVDVLRGFRGRERLVGLLGDWHHGEALIAFDPVRVAEDPFAAVDLPRREEPAAGFGGGWIGVWGYRIAHDLERIPRPHARPVPQPHHRIAFYERVLRRVDGEWWLESLGPADPADIYAALAHPGEPRTFGVGEFAMTPEPASHRAAVRRALDHIAAGDIFQVNLCARLEARFDGDPLELFCRGYRRLKPAYAAYVEAPEGTVASFSPELFLRRTGGTVVTSPIKGTAPLGTDPRDLLESGKDRAENIMIVDLMRNDLSRVCAPGSVRVPALVRPERHAVWHLVSDVAGRLAEGATDADLLRATFPPGSVTGAPKPRAMEIAAHLEATGREAYTGAIGHVSPAAGVELNVAIRTFEIAEGRVWLGVGGGIVAESTPEGEYAELLTKAAPLIEAIGGTLDHLAPAGGAGRPSTEGIAAASLSTGSLTTGSLSTESLSTAPTVRCRRAAAAPARRRAAPARVLFIDNYDSFVYNLVHDARGLGAVTEVVRNDETGVDDLVRAAGDGEFTHLVISPGPGAPAEAGISVEAAKALGPSVPVLGVCLGHQAIAEAYGARVVRARRIVHGKPSLLHHAGKGLFRGLPSPVSCARYHSLVVSDDGLPGELEVTARTASGTIMGLRHREHPTHGLQIHPESILTPHGRGMLRTFLAIGIAAG